MKPRYWVILSAVVAIAVIQLINPGLLIVSEEEFHSGDSSGNSESWACPMLCVVLDHPGPCPVCGMALEQLRMSDGAVIVGAGERDLIGLTLTRAELIRLHTRIQLPGTVTGAETSRAVITAWTTGRIDRFSSPATGERITAGTTVAWIYSPELIEAQHDLLFALRAIPGDSTIIAGARHRLRQLGASNWIIDQIAAGGSVMESLPVVTQYSGTVTNRLAESGDWVRPGQVLLEVANLSDIWIETELLQGQVGLISLQDTVMILPYSTANPVQGEVTHMDPFYDPVSRSVTARIQAVSPSADLIPGELVQIIARREAGGSEEPDLAVPETSVLSLGERHIVYILSSDSSSLTTMRMPSMAQGVTLEPRLVEIGPVSYSEDGIRYFPVLSGLSEGDIIAVEGAFLIDSQAELTGLPSLMAEPDL